MWPWNRGGRKDGSSDMSDETHQGEHETESSGAEIQDRIGQLEAELEDARGRALRVMADFQNYQRRALQNESVARQQGIAEVAGSVVRVIDHFDQALAQDAGNAGGQQVLAGLAVIREELLKALGQHGVSLISPERGELFVPGRHEAIMQQGAEDVEPGHVVSTFQPGYALCCPGAAGERVLRPAKVAVSPTE
jgi:molecular chaperone GrpE